MGAGLDVSGHDRRSRLRQEGVPGLGNDSQGERGGKLGHQRVQADAACGSGGAAARPSALTWLTGTA
jgi:hypothetical protein